MNDVYVDPGLWDATGYGVPIDWTWWHFAMYAAGLLVQRIWEISKWVRDRRRDGHPSGIREYFQHYPFISVVTIMVAISFFWVWAREAIRLTAVGIDLHVPYVPEFSFVMGFFSDGFAIYFVKMLRNFKNRVAGEPL